MTLTPSDGAISIAVKTPGLNCDAIEAVVTVPTFKRPQQLLSTLESLRAQQTQRRFAVIVMENEAGDRAGALAALPLFQSGHFSGMVIIAHERGNCSAYNAGWQTAICYFPSFSHLLVIDDDEVADENWLERMCRTAETIEADIVGGPQVPIFADAAHQKWARHPVFAPPYTQSGHVRALYSSGNLLVSRPVLAAMGPPFLDLKFNFMGGGDFGLPEQGGATGLQARLVRRSSRLRDRAGTARGGRLASKAEPAQRRYLHTGGKEEACRHAFRQYQGVPEKPGFAWPVATSRGFMGSKIRFAVGRALSRLCGARAGDGGVRICQ